MQRKPIRWDIALKRLFSPARRKPATTKLVLENLDDRIVPANPASTMTYNVSAAAADGAVSSLRYDISLANNDTKHTTFIFNLTAGTAGSGAYTITIANPPSGHEQQNAAGDLNIVNNASGTKTYEFVGQGSGAYITRANTVLDRIFEIDAKNGNINVTFQNVTIAGGDAADNGGVGAPNNATTAEGGGVLNEGGNVTFINARIDDNFAAAAFGANGFNGSNATKTGQIPGSGGFGASGLNAAGGGLYSTGGTITIQSSTFSGNQALAGHGGNGGNGGNINSKAITKSESSGLQGAAGGDGGFGGSAYGGGIYIAAGNLVFKSGSVISDNTALAGFGGAGGNGGNLAGKSKFDFGGPGGAGGAGGAASGGGIYSKSGSITLNGANSTLTMTDNNAAGGVGGAAGAGGNGSAAENIGGTGGAGGAGGNASAGGLYSQLGNVIIENKASIAGNQVLGGGGGAGGAGGAGDEKNKTSYGTGGPGGSGGVGGSAIGGGVYTVNGVVTIENESTVVSNLAEAGAGGSGGHGGGGKVHLGRIGGNGGDGGDASGGGLYTGLGTVTIEGDALIGGNEVVGNAGGKGGVGGTVGTILANGGTGGDGGAGGSVLGGGVYTTAGTINIQSSSEVIQNLVTAVGGGGAGGAGGADSAKSGLAGAGGNGGAGGDFGGGGVYNADGNVNVTSAAVLSNGVSAPGGGVGGVGGAGVKGDSGGAGGIGGDGGSTLGGGIFTAKGIVTIGANGIVAGNGGNAGAGGRGGNGGNAPSAPGTGGAGGAGGMGEGGGIYALAGGVKVTGETLNAATKKPVGGGVVEDDKILGGNGGHGGRGGLNAFNGVVTGGAGGTGGVAAGGGIWSSAAAVTISGLVASNLARGGHGGNAGQAGGQGGDGGSGQGGGVYSAYGAVTIQGVSLQGKIYQGKVEGNTGEGGVGGSGGDESVGNGGNGGNGGDAQGGGVFSAFGAVSVNNYSLVASNQAKANKGGAGGQGVSRGFTTGTSGAGSAPTITGGTGVTGTKTSSVGNGGTGGNGGNAQGGGIYIGTGKLDLSQANVSANVAGGNLHGGAGGGSFGSTGGGGGQGGSGGNAEGGGIYVSSGASILSITDSSVVNNTAGPGGVPGTGGATSTRNGAAGNAVGGGIYTAANSMIVNSTIAGNFADEAGEGGLSQGGGVYIGVLAPTALGGVSIDNSTIALNTSFDAGGGIRNVGSMTITSSLIADNTSKDTTSDDFSNGTNATATLEYTVVGTSTGYSNATTDSTDLLQTGNTGVYLNNTLSTAPSNDTEYVAFTGPSVAFNIQNSNATNPDNLTTDQIGNQRVVSGAGGAQYLDIGSIEVGGVAIGTPIIVASGKNGYVQVTNASTLKGYQYWQPFPGYTGVVSVSLGDVSGDQVPDIIVAANGVVKVYDGASAITSGVNFGVPSTWTGNQAGGASILPGGISTPLLYSFTPFAGYKGVLNLAAGDLVGNGYDDIIVGAAAGTMGRVAAFDGESGLNAKSPTLIGNIFEPFGTGFTGGISVAAGDLTGNGVADLIVGTQTKGDQVKSYQFVGTGFAQIGTTIAAFGALPSTAQLQVAAIDVAGQGVDEIAIGVLSGGYGKIDLVNEYGALQTSTINVGGGLTAMSIAAVNVNVSGTSSSGVSGSGADDLLIATVPKGAAQFFILNTANGDRSNSFYELPALTGGIDVAGI